MNEKIVEAIAFDIASSRLSQIIRENTDIINLTKDIKIAISSHDAIIRDATRLFKIMPKGKKLTMEFNKRPILSADDLYIVEEEKQKWIVQHKNCRK